MFPAREKVYLGETKVQLFLWLLYTTVQTLLNNFVRLDWLSWIENFFLEKGEILFFVEIKNCR